jgi:hypothetical protein
MPSNPTPFARRAKILVDALKHRQEKVASKAALRRAEHDEAVTARAVRSERDDEWAIRRKRGGQR